MALLINNITDAASQQFNLVSDTGQVISFSLQFLSTQNGWGFNVGYNGFELNGGYLTLSPNFLRGYRNIIPFGIMCTSIDGYEPQFIEDFLSGRISLYLLNATEVQEIEAGIYAD